MAIHDYPWPIDHPWLPMAIHDQSMTILLTIHGHGRSIRELLLRSHLCVKLLVVLLILSIEPEVFVKIQRKSIRIFFVAVERKLKFWFWVFVWIIVALVQPCFNISPNFLYKTHNTQPTCSSKSKWDRKSSIIQYARWHTLHTWHRSRAAGAGEKMKSALT